MSRQPVVVVVGRPNVGKSTLFNRLTRSRRALVHNLPGVTRDRIFGEAERLGGGMVTLVDTGGLLMEDEDTFVPLIRGQAESAIRDGDVVIFLLDGEAGPIPEDREISDYLRGLGVPVVPVVNKGDRVSQARPRRAGGDLGRARHRHGSLVGCSGPPPSAGRRGRGTRRGE